MVTLVLRDGQKVTPWMDYQIGRLDHDFEDAFGLNVKVRSAIRTKQDQLDIWYDRYVTAGNVRGRRVYDTRWWNGQLWYRISSAGTVAQPGTSNHEIQGDKAAVDIYDTGSDAGVTVASSTRGKWIRRNAHKYDLIASGDGFREGWHFDVKNIFKTPPKPTIPTEDDMIINIKGKRGSRRGGLYFVSGGRATFIGPRGKTSFPQFSNEKEIAILQKRIKGLR